MAKGRFTELLITILIYVINLTALGLLVVMINGYNNLRFLKNTNKQLYNELQFLPEEFFNLSIGLSFLIVGIVWLILYLILRKIRIKIRSRKKDLIIEAYNTYLRRTLKGQILTLILNLFRTAYGLIIIIALYVGIEDGGFRGFGAAILIILLIGLFYWIIELIFKGSIEITGFKDEKAIEEKLNDLNKKPKLFNKKKKNSSKEMAFEELKRLKELLDLELLTQQEFEAKSKELKEIILESKDATD